MSLTGNLEDLPLLDILQIVSFSKKTGYLGISTTEGEGAIVFSEGSVVACYTWELKPLEATGGAPRNGHHASLVRRRIEMALERLIRLREGQFQFSLTEATPRVIKGRDITGETLDPGINPQELLLELARGMDEDRRDSSAALEASFAEAETAAPETETPARPAEPQPTTQPPPGAPAEPRAAPPGSSPVDAIDYRTVRFVAPRDVSPEYTMPLPAIPAELPRAKAQPAPTEAEAPAAEEVEPASGRAPAEPAEEAAAPASGTERTLLLVDDEEDVRRSLAQSLTQGGYQVLEAEDPESAVKKAQRLHKAGIAFTLLTDLGMPASGGASFQGGFEVVKRLGKMKVAAPVVMMTDTLSNAVKTRARQMKIDALEFKPGLSKLDPVQYQADLQAFARRLLEQVLPGLGPGPASAPPRPALAQPAPPRPAVEERSSEIRLLQLHMEELRDLRDPGRLPPLVMRVARHFFERGVMFLVKDEEVRGLGGFGPAGQGESLGNVARQLLVPLAEPSMFLDVVSSGKPFVGEPDTGGWNDAVRARLGRFRAGAVALVPLIAHRDTIAILYADNPETGRPLEHLETLELFMHQAGIALENALLQRKLRSPAETG